MAADRPHRGHFARLHRRPGGAGRQGLQRGLQRRLDRAQLPHPRDRRDRRGCRAGCRLEFASDAGPDTRSYSVDFDKLARVLPDAVPKWDARAGAEQLYAAYKASGLTLAEFEGPRYQRIAHIRQLIADGILAPDLRHTEQWDRSERSSPRSIERERFRQRERDPGPGAGLRGYGAEIYDLARSSFRSAAASRARACAIRSPSSAGTSSFAPGGPDRQTGLRLDGAEGMDHPRRLHKAPDGRGSSTSPPRTFTVLNYSVPVHDFVGARRAEGACLQPAGPARPGALPHVLLCRALGLLHGAQRARELPEGDYEVCIDWSCGTAAWTMANIFTPARRTGNSCCPPISAIPRSPTTIAPGWRC